MKERVFRILMTDKEYLPGQAILIKSWNKENKPVVGKRQHW